MFYALLRAFLIATVALVAAGTQALSDASEWPEPTEARTARPDRARARLTPDLPGERIFWLENFTGDGVGDFPRRMKLESGDFEVAEIKGRHYLRTVEGGVVTFTLPEVLPKRLPNLPNAQIPRSSKIRLRLPGGSENDPTLITVIRIAEGGRKLQ